MGESTLEKETLEKTTAASSRGKSEHKKHLLGETVRSSENKDEYLMLRNEIMQADILKNNVISYMYTFVGAILAFTLGQSDNIFMLLPYVGLYPAYFIVLSNNRTIYRDGSYLLVFHEETFGNFQWESRLKEFYAKKNGTEKSILSKIDETTYPFLFVSATTTFFLILKADWTTLKAGFENAGLQSYMINPYFAYEATKVTIGVVLLAILWAIVILNRKNRKEDYIGYWRTVDGES